MKTPKQLKAAYILWNYKKEPALNLRIGLIFANIYIVIS